MVPRSLLILALALGLSACTLRAPSADGPAPAQGLTAETIEVTPLDGAAAEPQAGQEATAPAPAADAPPVEAATADTPHPRARPGDAPTTAAGGEASDTPPREPVKSPQQMACEAGHGVWGQSPETGAFLCQKRTSDGGKVCRARGDCQGECLARSGTCAPVAPLLGCNAILDDQGREMTQCLD